MLEGWFVTGQKFEAFLSMLAIMSIFCWVQARDSEDKLVGSFANGGAVLFLFDLQLFVMEATPWSFAFQLEAPNSWDVQEGKTAPV